jgi:hypothetical protein
MVRRLGMVDVILGRWVEREGRAFTCYTLYFSLEVRML